MPRLWFWQSMSHYFVSGHLHRVPTRGHHTLNKIIVCVFFCKIQYKKRNTIVCCFVRTNRWYLIFDGSGPTVCSAWNPALLEICYVHCDSVMICLVCEASSHCNRKLWMIISVSHWNCFLKSMQTWLRYMSLDEILSMTISIVLCYLTAVKDTGTKAYLRERILGGAYFNEGVCDVNHNSVLVF